MQSELIPVNEFHRVQVHRLVITQASSCMRHMAEMHVAQIIKMEH